MKSIQDQIKEPDGLRRYLVPWSIYVDGARTMLLKLRDHGLIEETRSKTGLPHAKGDDLIYNKALIDLLTSSKDNVDRFLSDDYSEIRFTDHERDKKGKLVRCRAYFAKKVTIYQEIK
ncbi:MAG: hypothetical protein NC311_14900 [Muribaculaceae bacterium]|nr:hypothetical protein [Muribaculaceae bacterium]